MFEQTFKNIDDVLWKEAGCSSELDYTEQSSWMLFLKYLDDLEQEKAMEAELVGKSYDFIISEPYQWSQWAAPKKADGSFDHDTALTGDDLITFIDDELFPYLRGFKQRASGPDTIEYKIGEIFGEIKSKFRSGYSLRDALELTDGEIEEGKRYTESDFNRVIEIRQREQYRVKLFMQTIKQNQKTLVFCATQDHALAVRDLVNQTKTGTNPDYCVRVTANEGELGEQHLRTFQDNEKTIPTILTTSQKLSTGVNARNIRNIVLMRPINSMIEFKQIIGRGTRLFEGKDYFTIYDFVKAYEHFNDPEWDGEPAEPPEPIEAQPEGEDPQPTDTDESEDPEDGDDERKRRHRVKVKLADGKERTIQHMMATTFWSPDGKPMSAAQFVERLFGELRVVPQGQGQACRW